jgi:hypothetical protein
MDKPPQSLNGRSETGRVGMTGPVIHGRAGRPPLPLMPPANYPVSLWCPL